MTTGYNWKKLVLVNFGDQNISRSEEFGQLTNVLSDRIYFEAIRSLLDCNYLNEKVTKRRNTDEESFVELKYEYGGRKCTFKRVFGERGRIFLNGKVVKAAPGGLMCQQVTYCDTPTTVMDQFVSEVFREKSYAEKNLARLMQYIRMSNEYNAMAITMEANRDIKNNIGDDLNVLKAIEQIQWKWIMSRHNRTDSTHYDQVNHIAPANPIDAFRFSDSLVNVYMASFHSNVATHQVEMFKNLIKRIDCQQKAYADDIDFPQNWERMRKAVATSKILEQHDEKQLAFYNANINIVSKYKEDFPTADAWEMEKANMNVVEETRFQDQLKNFETRVNTGVERVRAKIDDTVNAMNQMILANFSASILLEPETYVSDIVMGSLNEFSEVLCEMLNNPMLKTANIPSNLVGWVQYITNNAAADRKPEFIFEHVSSSNLRRSEHLFNYLQTYLTPLSNVHFADTRDEAIDFLEAMESMEPNDECSQTTYVFAANDSITPGKARAKAKSKPLTTLGSKFGYSDKFKNLLSNCQITRNKKMTAKNSNLLNLKTKRISLANNEKLFATTDSGYLFELLLRIKNVYENIGEYFLGAKDFEEQWTIRADNFTKTLSDFCNTESLWLTKLTNVMTMVFEELNVTHLRQAVKSLQYKSASRLTIHEQLLSLQYADRCDDSSFVEILSQQNAETLTAELYDVDASTIRLPETCDLFHRYVRYLRTAWDHSKTDLINIHAMWQQKCEDLFVEPNNDDLAKRLSTISSVDLTQCQQYIRKMEQRRKIPSRHRKNNNLQYQQVFSQIDRHMPRLHYPMGSKIIFEACLLNLEKNEQKWQNRENLIDMRATVLPYIMQDVGKMLTKLCTRITTAVASNDGYSVHCRLMKARCGNIYQPFAHQVYFYRHNGKTVDPDTTDVISILSNLLFIRQFTESPIVVNELMEGCDVSTFEYVLEFIKTKVADRFALICDPNLLAANNDQNPTHRPNSGHSGDNGNIPGPQSGAPRSNAMRMDEVHTEQNVDNAQRMDVDANDDQNGQNPAEAMDVDDDRADVPLPPQAPAPCAKCGRVAYAICFDCVQDCCRSCEEADHEGHNMIPFTT